MARCITCGAELHPERALKYDYCMAPACQEKNAKALTMVAIGMNKAADELVILDEHTREDLANGKYQDQRRGSFGPPAPKPAPAAPVPGPAAAGGATKAAARPPRPSQPASATPAPARAIQPPCTRSQRKLTLLYNSQGLRPDEIAGKVGISRYLVTQIILAARNRGKS